MTTDPDVKAAIAGGFEIVHINYSKENKNLDTMRRLGNPEKLGFPVLVVLSPALEVLHTQESGSLETGRRDTVGHDPAKVVAFLREWSQASAS
jgi:hypothetical protein